MLTWVANLQYVFHAVITKLLWVRIIRPAETGDDPVRDCRLRHPHAGFLPARGAPRGSARLAGRCTVSTLTSLYPMVETAIFPTIVGGGLHIHKKYTYKYDIVGAVL